MDEAQDNLISIHSPHARGDRLKDSPISKRKKISIHSPHARGDSVSRFYDGSRQNFNPLPSCEGRHPAMLFKHQLCLYFNPLPSCEGRQGDYIMGLRAFLFQSTPLMRGETMSIILPGRMSLISIHSPHARGDDETPVFPPNALSFQSTPLMRGETIIMFSCAVAMVISIHSPHARGDVSSHSMLFALVYFNPLPSCEGRREAHILRAMVK